MATEYQLKRGNNLLGRLSSHSSDFPWVNCKFEPAASCAELKPLFDEELRLMDSEDIVAWEESYEKIGVPHLRLVVMNGGDENSEFLLHLAGNEAWFRF